MQRWIVAGAVLMVLMMGGAYYGYRTYQQNRSTRVWLPMPVNQELPVERRDAMAKLLKEKLSDHSLLVEVSKDVRLTEKMKYASNDAAATDLEKRLFSEVGEAESPLGKVPSINVGLNCKVKEFKTMGEVINRLRKDIFKVLGIEEPRKEVF